MPSNVKTTVYLEVHDYERLKAIARREGRTAAELVREAVRRYADLRGGRKPRSLGLGRSGIGDLSERAEELLHGLRIGGDPELYPRDLPALRSGRRRRGPRSRRPAS